VSLDPQIATIKAFVTSKNDYTSNTITQASIELIPCNLLPNNTDNRINNLLTASFGEDVLKNYACINRETINNLKLIGNAQSRKY
jgi:hypothetical protein